ncbi:MAG: YihY/virulence factor BrkB family protein, partial [Candidatus Dormiibacterota bacterium]
MKLLVLRIQQLRPVRVIQQFGQRQGNLLAAGMSYQALFAIFAAIWLIFSVAGIWLTSNPALLHSFISVLNRSVPGLIGSGGAISEDALTRVSGTLGWTGIIAAVGLLLTATGWLSYTRTAVRAMFRLGNDPTNPVLQKLRDLGLAFVFGILLIAAALVSLISTAVIRELFALFGISHDSFWSFASGSAIGFLITAALNTITLAGMFRLLSHLAIPLRRLLVGALLGGIALAVLSTLSGLVLGGASRNPLAASFAVIIGLLIWFNLVCRVLLIAASWIAVGMADAGLSAKRTSAEERAAE